MTERASARGATFGMRGQLYRGHTNATALALSSRRLSKTRALHLYIIEETLGSRWI